MLRSLLIVLSLWCCAKLGLAATEEPVYAPQAPVPVPGFMLKNTANFDELRHNVLELISSSKKRVWLITDYLTDGDVVSALFLAKYRKVDVKVFLGHDKQNQYLSRLNYLKAQNIPVFIRPEHGFIAPTLIFVDQRLFTINRDLNSLARVGQAQIAQASPLDVKNFVSWFGDALEYPEQALPRQDMKVGRSRSSGGGVSSSRNAAEEKMQGPAYQGESDGSYNYNRSSLSRRAPEGVSTVLPRVPVWQKNRDIRLKNPSPPSSTDSPAIAPMASPTQPSVVEGQAIQGPTAPSPSDTFRPDPSVPSGTTPTGQIPEERR